MKGKGVTGFMGRNQYVFGGKGKSEKKRKGREGKG